MPRGLTTHPHERYALPWNMLKRDVVEDGCAVPIDKTGLKDAPRQSKCLTPACSLEYGGQVNGHDGL